MKNKIIVLFVFAVLITSVSFNIILANYQSNIESELQEKDKLINRIKNNQTKYGDSIKKYAKTIEKYVDDCNFEYGGKSISSTDLITFVNRKLEENDELKLELDNCSDSLKIKNDILAEAKKHYGINYIIEKTANGYTISKPYPTKLDSALVLFPHYKDKIKLSEDGKNWVITKTPKK
ncbi:MULTISPECIES: hypothetical protein [Flavobacterium]|uniref:Uncharacterized protein n=1 Tax=Flavobacterium hankyongi TaxID=1176532 RepID=A0ABP8ZXG0_9FLAO|nr:hypothetical protein [Flavobacterium sp. N1846]